MYKAKVTELTLEDFQKFGSFARMLNPEAVKIGAAPVEFYRDLILLSSGRDTGVSFSTCRVAKRPLTVKELEFHTFCPEGILPLDGDALLGVAPATAHGDLPWDRVEVFRVPQGTIVTLRPGVWHCAPFAFESDAVNVLIALPERVYANDCTVIPTPMDLQTEIE
jgi:ureidoglycolate lyase